MGYYGNVETRVLFLGEPNCGKRSLLHYFIFDQKVEAEAEEEIIDDENEKEKEPQQSEFIKELHLDNKTLLAHFFVKDIPADNLVFNDREEENKYDCYIVLFDMGLWPESGNRARKLFNTISSKKKLMVGCKSDLFQKGRARRTHCVPCSVVNNYNIDNVFEQVTEILQFQDVSVSTPNLRVTPSISTETETSEKHNKKDRNVRKSVLRVVNKLRTNSISHHMQLDDGTADTEEKTPISPRHRLVSRRETSPVLATNAHTTVTSSSDNERIGGGREMNSLSSEAADVETIASEQTSAGSRHRDDDDDDDDDDDEMDAADAEEENELGDTSLDQCEEKSMLDNENIVSSKQLLFAAWRQNVKNFTAVLKDLKQSGANFNVCDPVNTSGDTMLHELVRKPGWLPALKAFISSNVITPNELTQLLNAKNSTGNTALHIVAGRGNEEYLDTLLKSSADIFSENDRGQTALHMAIEMDKYSIVERLCAHNKELVVKNDRQGNSSYKLAIDLDLVKIAELLHPFFVDQPAPDVVQNQKYVEIVKKKLFELTREEDTGEVYEMLENDAALANLKDEHGRTPLHIAALGRKESLIPELLLKQGANINEQDNNGNTPLHWAASHPSGFHFAKLFIENQAKIDIPNKDGNLPLHMAVFCGNVEFVEYVLTKCNPITAGLKRPNSDENTPLHIICALAYSNAQFERIVQLMTEKRAETNAVNSRKETPLHIAAAAGCTRIHPSLCDQLDSRDIFGNTPLLCASRSLNIGAVQNLLDMGALLDTSNFDNENILHMLAYRDISQVTEEDSAQCISLLKKLERKNQHKELLRSLLSQSTTSANETPMFYAVSSNRLNLAKFYLRRGPPTTVNSINISGDSPLHIAVQKGNRGMVDLLIRKDAKLNCQNKEGYTPLHYACHPRLNQVADRIVKKLRAADLLVVTSEGLSTLHLAAQAGNLHLVQKLIEKSQRKDGSIQLLQLKTQHNNTALIYAMSNNHSKVASYLAKRQTFDKNQEDDFVDRLEFRKEPYPHIYPVILPSENLKVSQRMDIFSTTYNIYEGKLKDEDIIILEANSASSAVRLAHEVAIMSMIGNHPNVQRLLGASPVIKQCYLPFLPNCSTLDAILNELVQRKETCDTLQVLTIAEGIANGMKCLHTATVSKPTILHNALTPRAILIDEQNAKLSSFGSARVHFAEDSEQQDKRELPLPQMDEVRYLAPEVIRGEPPSKQSDVYSFAMILWHLAASEVPYGEVPLEDLISVLSKGITRPPLDNVDSGISALISACWDHNPDVRPSFEEICDRLNSLHVDNVEAMGRNRKLPVLRAKASPFPCCKPREFRIMNKLKKRNKESNNSSIYLCTFEGIVCAVKMWPPNQSQQDQMKCSLQIFTIKSLCECESVVRYIYSDTDKNGQKCLFMEYMNQGTVAQLINTRKTLKGGAPLLFTPQEIIHYSLPIAKALKFMHKFSTVIVHQDIQAENVLLTDREGKKHIVKLGGFSAMHTLQNSEEHEVYRDIEGFALYLYQLLTFTTRVKNNWKSQVQKLNLNEAYKPFVGILHGCLDPIERPTSVQLVDRLSALEKQFGGCSPGY